MAKVKAYAKLNLTLDVLGVSEGYHQLDSLVCTIDLYDTVLLKKRRDTLVNVYMHGKGSENIPPEQNNAVKAGEAFVREFSTCGADITILKDIPMGGGLGGSSADVAGVLLGMKKLYKIQGEEERLKRIADSLGSDSGYLLTGGFARIRGRGERVERLHSPMPLHFLLIEPPTGVSTKECFSLLDSFPQSEPLATPLAVEALQKGDLFSLAKVLNNHLEKPAVALNPDVAKAVAEGNSFSPLACRMTGSGSCVYVLFENEEYCRWAQSRYAGKFKTRVVKSVSGEEKFFRSPYALTAEEEKIIKEGN